METAGLQTARLTNTINGIGFGAFNHWGTIDRGDILTSYNKQVLETAWILFTKYIIKNYESGKGTFIKNFGTFTFTNADYSLEGTTNQFQRDYKVKRPVFLVSNEFLDYLKPGQYTKAGGLIYYTQKLNNAVNIVKINYAELAYGMNISKEEYMNILNNIIKEMGDQILKKNFKSREMPNLGILLLRGNVFGMKFYKDFDYTVMKIPQKYNFTKRNLELFMDTLKTQQRSADVKDAEKAVNEIRPKTAIITNVSKGANAWMNKYLDINPKEYDDNKQYEFNNVENYNKDDKWNSQNFFPVKDLKNTLKEIKVKKTLKDLMFPKSILEAIVSNKGQIIKEMKNYDRRNNGIITRFEVVRSFSKANIHPNLTVNNFNDIIKIYAEGLETIDYLKLMTLLIKEIKAILRNSSFIKYSEDDFSSSFNNKFKLGPEQKTRRSLSFSAGPRGRTINNLNANNYINNYNNLDVIVDEVENEIKSLKMIFDEIMYKKIPIVVNNDRFNDNNRNINYNDFMALLHLFDITYPTEKIFKILKFIKIEDPKSFSLNLMYKKLKECKLSSYEMTNFELEEAYANLMNILKNLGGKNFLFDNSQELLFHHFTKKLYGKTQYTKNILQFLFNKITNNNPKLTPNDYDKATKIDFKLDGLNEKFYNETTEKMKEYMKQKKINANKYYDHLLSYNYLRKFNHLPKKDFILALQQEPFNYNEEQSAFIFEKMDLNKDGIVDRNEFKKCVNEEHNAIVQMQDIIKKMKLDKNDLAFRLDIKPEKNEKLTFYPFKNKFRKFDFTYTNEFIEALYIELAGSLNDELYTNDLLDKLDVYKKGQFVRTNQDTFKSNFIENIQNVVDFHTLKNAFEKIDKKFTGKVPKNSFCQIIHQFTKEFKDEDILRLIRFLKLSDQFTYEVNYSQFLNIIYYNHKLDPFLTCIEHLKKLIIEKQFKNINELMTYLNNGKETNFLTVDQLLNYFMKVFPIEIQETITKTMLCKFDLDSDGNVSYDDLKGIINRYISTSFFKYENSEKGQFVNLYASENLNEETFKAIVREIKKNLKKKNVTEIGLFKKLDEDNDGFISNHEFNKNISNIVELSPAIKDKIFNYLDYYHNGLVDLETFLLRFKEFKSNEVIVHNNNKIENVIVKEFAKWIIENKQLSDSELFEIIDKDSDGIISINDLKYFVVKFLEISDIEFNNYKLERVMQMLSTTKNKNIGLVDIKEFRNRANSNNLDSLYIDLTETLKQTTNQNLFRGKKNVDWINQVIERFGMFISEKYDNLESFYNKFSDKESGKFKYENFIKFVDDNYECFQGFNLTKDELLAVYTSLDSQKKNFLNFDDFKNKLNIFDFYKKMQFNIKQFLIQNFPTSLDAFRFFLPSDINKTNSFSKTFTSSFSNNSTKISNNYRKDFLTKKEFFDGINYLFPNKYPTETILKYLKKYFNIDENDNSSPKSNITYSQFSFIFFGKITPNKNLFSKANLNKETRINNSRSQITARSFSARPIEANIYSDDPTGDHPNDHLDHPFDITFHPKLSTPFDYDPLEKLKRNIVACHTINYINIVKNQIKKHPNGICNVFEFRNLLKQLGLGLTTIEIEDIINKNGRTWNGLVNLNEFYKFITNNNRFISTAENNINITLSEIKQLLYKFYSNPKLAFSFSDSKGSNIMDFEKYKSIISELYKREGKNIPNFTLMKNTFDCIDMKKDGLIDMNEWTNTFGKIGGKLDLINNNNISNKRKSQLNTLRKWETSNNVTGIYKAIARNRKTIWDKVKNITLNKKNRLVHEDNLISVLKDIFPNYKLSNTQWKMIVEIGDKDSNNFINFDTFIKLVEHTSMREGMPKF